MDKIIITGISGFVGSNLRPYLVKRKYEVVGISRNPKSGDQLKYEALNMDVLNSSKAIIHLAGLAHDVKKTSDEAAYFKVNTELTNKLFREFLNSDCPVFVYLSSVKAVADSMAGVLTEETEPNPKTAYGRSKLAAEISILSETIPAGKYVYILRPCMIHGPGNKGNLNLLFSMVKNGIPYPLGKFENQRSFLSIENLCFTLEQLITKNPESGVYNVADNGALSTNALVRLIYDSLNRKPRIWRLPVWFARFAAAIGGIFSLPFNSERLHKLTEDYVVDNKKIVTALGAPLPLDIEEGIKHTLKSFS